MHCTIIAALVSCVGIGGPRPSPEAAVAALKGTVAPYVYVEPAPRGPVFVVIGREPSAGPWAFPAPAPERRLDGTLASRPPVVYGSWRIVPRRRR